MTGIMTRMADGIGAGVRAALAGRVGALDARIQRLETRLVELEGTTAVYRGVHVAGAAYPQGAMVTRGGSLWIAEAATSATPGEPASRWRLAVKGNR
jgi:hypothetical protein